MNELQRIEYKEQGGICRFCGQITMVKAPENSAPEDLNRLATEQCDCDGAQLEREKKMRLEAAGEWAKNIFKDSQERLQLALCGIHAAFEYKVDKVTIKKDKNTYTIDLDSEGMIRIKTKFTDNDIETF